MQTNRDLVSEAHLVYECVYLIEWCSKYRFNVFKKEDNKKDMESILQKIAEENEMKINELAVMPGHIHIIIRVKPNMSLSKATQLLKKADHHASISKFIQTSKKDIGADTYGHQVVVI